MSVRSSDNLPSNTLLVIFLQICIFYLENKYCCCHFSLYYLLNALQLVYDVQKQ